MKATKALTEDQVALIRELDPTLDPAIVTFEKRNGKENPKATLRCQITVHLEGGVVKYWVSRDGNGKLKLEDEKPSLSAPQQNDDQDRGEAGTDSADGSICGADGTIDVDALSEEVDDMAKNRGLSEKEKALVLARLAKVGDDDPALHGPARGEVESWLRECGLSEQRRAVVLARHFDGKSTREIAAEIGKSKSLVNDTLNSSIVRECLKHLQSGQPLPLATTVSGLSQSAQMSHEAVSFPARDWNSLYRLRGWTPPSPGLVTTSGSKAIPLCDVKRCASELFKERGGMDKHGPSDYWPTSSEVPPPTPEFARAIVQHIRSSPGALLNWDGRFYLETLVELLEAANWGVDRAGWCDVAIKKHRKTIAADKLPYMPFVASGWDRKHVAKAARKILEGLWQRGPGDSLAIPPEILIELLDGILERVAELQAEWKSFSVGRKDSGLASFREAHAVELRDFTEQELRSNLDGDLLKVACRLAEREIGVSAETFLRYHRGARVRLREKPYADGRLAFKRLLKDHSDGKA